MVYTVVFRFYGTLKSYRDTCPGSCPSFLPFCISVVSWKEYKKRLRVHRFLRVTAESWGKKKSLDSQSTTHPSDSVLVCGKGIFGSVFPYATVFYLGFETSYLLLKASNWRLCKETKLPHIEPEALNKDYPYPLGMAGLGNTEHFWIPHCLLCIRYCFAFMWRLLFLCSLTLNISSYFFYGLWKKPFV